MTWSYGLICAIVAALDQILGRSLSVGLRHFQRNGQNHEHMVYSIDAHGIHIRQDVAASDSALEVWVLYQWVEEVGRRYELYLLISVGSLHPPDAAIRSLLGY